MDLEQRVEQLERVLSQELPASARGLWIDGPSHYLRVVTTNDQDYVELRVWQREWGLEFQVIQQGAYVLWQRQVRFAQAA